ncbi:MAG: EpsG family protein [Clostridia bacterium]|nr:EpsG family protein [Clostridia bacterium]
MNYFLALFWMMFTSIVGHTAGMYHRERVLGKEERRATWTYALFVMVPIILIAGMRTIYFGDTTMYVRSFQSIPSSLRGKWEYAMVTYTKDHGFYLLGAFISLFVGVHARYYLLILAAIHGLILAKVYRRFSDDYWFSVFVFIASTDIYSWMYNGLRQFTAVTITLLAAEPIMKKRYIKACLIIVFASFFHQSALLMLPVVFIVQGRPWNWKTLLVIAGTVGIMAFSGAFTGALDTALQDTQYRNVVSDWTRWQDDGTNPLRVLVYSVPTILSLFCRKKIIRSGDRVIQVACNMSIVSTALYLISMVTSGLFMGRLPIYCSLYANGILLPWELKHVFGRNLRLVAIVCYVGFYFIQLIMGWGV